ncbi:MAG: 4'-phosphopantetheinyl transferase [Patiriisocius sp.]|jgi:4'-phosphopantetheinyl transferase
MSNIFCETIKITQENLSRFKDYNSDITLFKIRLSSYYQLVPELLKYLNEAELHRAKKYHFEKDSNQFIICRSLLKLILSQHTGKNISQINIEIDTNKKPYLSSNKAIYFNISHSNDFAIIAVSKYTVGIDLEYLNKNFDFSEVLSTVFSNPEIKSVINNTDKTYQFFKFWTRKEAIVKATGQGISDHLTKIPALDGHHDIDSKLLDGFKNFQILSFDLNEDYIVSIALCDDSLKFNNPIVYELPNSIKGLVLFSNLISI